MKDFDIIRAERRNAERAFRIGGEEFTFYPSVPASAQADYEDRVGTTTSIASLEAMDDFIFSVLPENQHEKWKRVRAATGEDNLSVSDIIEVVRHVSEVTSGRPTEPSGDSSGQASQPGTRSKGASSSPVEEG